MNVLFQYEIKARYIFCRPQFESTNNMRDTEKERVHTNVKFPNHEWGWPVREKSAEQEKCERHI